MSEKLGNNQNGVNDSAPSDWDILADMAVMPTEAPKPAPTFDAPPHTVDTPPPDPTLPDYAAQAEAVRNETAVENAPDMPKKTSPTQELYKKIFGELPKRDMTEADLPGFDRVLETLNDIRLAEIIKMRFGLGDESMSRADVAKELGVTPGRIGQLEAKAIRQLQHEGRNRKIRPLFATYEEMREEINERDWQIDNLKSELQLAREEIANLRNGGKESVEDLDPPTSPSYLSMEEYIKLGIEELGLQVGAYNCLKRGGINTIAELMNRSQDDLYKFRNMGKRYVDEIVAKTGELGLHFKDSDNQ